MKIQDITEGYGRYYCSTDKKWKTRKGPKQTRKVNEGWKGALVGGAIGAGLGALAGPDAASFTSTIGAWIGGSIGYGVGEKPTTNKKISPAIYSVYKNGEQVSDSPMTKYNAALLVDELVSQEHSTKTEFTIIDINSKKIIMRVWWQSNNTNPDVDIPPGWEKTRHDGGWGRIGPNESAGQGVAEEKQRLDAKCWDGYKKQGTKMKGDTRVNNCVKEELEETYDGDEFFEAYGELWYNEDEQLDEAEYQGRSVPLGKPMQGDVKKFKVYVKDPSTGNVKKVNFGDPDMKIKKSNPARRRSFRARHNCDNPGPRTKARYWSCRKW